ncbi:MAG: flagellin [Clostridiales bacterium GWF2_38_85]|nr:MAG: flagellin [Clostridiales bacterium GWF2_38_85]HBL83439.1 flagellin [Clostridiales bacterium]
MRISNNVAAMNTYRQYNSNAVATNKSMEKLSSGSRINRAADDAAGLSISNKMRSQIRGLTQANRNAQDGISFIQTAEGALNEASDMLTRIKELAVQVQNGTYSDDDKVNIGSEMKALGTAISEIYANTKFNGIAVFGTQVNTAGVLTAQDGSGTASTIKYGENATQSVTIDQATTTKLSALTTLTAAATTATNAALVTVTSVEDAITEVNTERAGYGALQNQLEHASNNMATTKENLQTAESRVRDVDMAEEMMNYTKNNILLQAAQSMLAQANSQPQGVLQLLQ